MKNKVSMVASLVLIKSLKPLFYMKTHARDSVFLSSWPVVVIPQDFLKTLKVHLVCYVIFKLLLEDILRLFSLTCWWAPCSPSWVMFYTRRS